MNAYWKYNMKYSKHLHFPKIKNPVNDVKDLTSGILDKPISVGRSWRSNELRLKSDSDLHKLWYVLLKEKLALKSDIYKVSQVQMTNKRLESCMGKVKVSMKRLRTVMGERATLRNEFLMFLEFYYIRKKQLNPDYKILSDAAVVAPVTDVEEQVIQKVSSFEKVSKKEKVVIRGVLADEKAEEKIVEKNVEYESKPEVKDETKSTSQDAITVLDDNELKAVEKLKKKYTNLNEFLDDYVTNRKLLRGKEKRKVVAHIDGARAKQAKHIFMKEMAALSYQFKNTSTSKNPNIQKLENIA